MSKLRIIDGYKIYEINKAQDLYDLYNDWAIDYGLYPDSMTAEEDETVSAIREEYIEIFNKIEKKDYELLEFEVIALEIIGG